MPDIHGMPTIEEQREQARQWAQYFRDAGYEISFQYTGDPEPFDREWQVWTAGPDTQRIATIDIDGTGASWHGPDELWLEVVGPHSDMIDDPDPADMAALQEIMTDWKRRSSPLN